MICNKNYFTDILRVCAIKDLNWVMRFQSPKVYHALILFIIQMYDVASGSIITQCIKSINHWWFTDFDNVMK